MPINDSLYALFERFLGMSGNIASIATTKTQALTENCIVCRSQRTEVVFEPALVDVPEDLLVVDPGLAELRCRGRSFAVADEVEDAEACVG